MKKHQLVIWLIFAALYIFGVSTAHGWRQPGTGRNLRDMPYAPLTGIVIETNTYYAIKVLKAPDAPANPRLENGVLSLHLWRVRGGAWCDAETILATDQEQPINPFLFQPGDILAIEQWDGYTYTVRGYDAKGVRVSETTLAGAPSQHQQITTQLGCN